MGIAYNTSIVRNGLVLHLDAANPRNFALTTVEVLIVAGGGSGGGYGSADGAGGGGAGGLIYTANYTVAPGSAVAVTVGAGGAGVGGSQGVLGSNGQNSVFGTLTAIGGGGGGTEGVVRVGQPGGSGGGAGGYGVKPGGAGTAGQGNRGGDCTAPGDGGGGGAGAAGQSGTTGIGGIGLQYSISGTPTYYAGGGGASGDNRNVRGQAGGVGGLGGGGKGQDALSTDGPVSGTPNTGGGGGAAAGKYWTGVGKTSGSGGSGIVIVRYQGPQRATGGTITKVDNDTVHTFTTVGASTFTPLSSTALAGIPDISGNGNFGTAINGPTYSSTNGGSIVFDGVDDYSTIPASFTYNFGAGDFTVDIWFNPRSLTGGSNTAIPILSQFAWYINSNSSWSLYFSPGTQKLSFSATSGANGDAYLPPYTWGVGSIANSLYINNWYNVTITRIGSVMSMYINGVLHSSSTAPTPNYTVNPSTRDLVVGYFPQSNSSTGLYYNGAIGPIKLYKGNGLSQAEITQNFEALRGRYGI